MFESVQNGPEDPIAKKWWPDVTNIRGARKAIRFGMWTAIIVGLVSIAVTVWSWEAVGIIGPINAVLFLAFAGGMYRCSLVAAVAALALYLIGRVVTLVYTGETGGFLALIILMAFANAVRGAFAYRQLLSTSAPAPK